MTRKRAALNAYRQKAAGFERNVASSNSAPRPRDKTRELKEVPLERLINPQTRNPPDLKKNAPFTGKRASWVNQDEQDELSTAYRMLFELDLTTMTFDEFKIWYKRRFSKLRRIKRANYHSGRKLEWSSSLLRWVPAKQNVQAGKVVTARTVTVVFTDPDWNYFQTGKTDPVLAHATAGEPEKDNSRVRRLRRRALLHAEKSQVPPPGSELPLALPVVSNAKTVRLFGPGYSSDNAGDGPPKKAGKKSCPPTKRKGKQQMGGQGDYKQVIKDTIRSALDAAGGAAGEMVGSKLGNAGAGRRLGSKLAQKLSRLIGSGDYVAADNVVANTLIKPQALNASATNMTFGNDPGSVVFSSREYFDDVNSVQGNPFVLTGYPVNPGLFTTFPYLSNLAERFEQYEFMGLVFEFVSTTSSYSNPPGMGDITLAMEYNATAPPFANKQEINCSDYAISFRPDKSAMYGVECKKQAQGQYYVRDGDSTTPLNLTDIGIFYVALSLSDSYPDNSNLGELWVSYEVRFSKPIFRMPNFGFAFASTTSQPDPGAPAGNMFQSVYKQGSFGKLAQNNSTIRSSNGQAFTPISDPALLGGGVQASLYNGAIGDVFMLEIFIDNSQISDGGFLLPSLSVYTGDSVEYLDTDLFVISNELIGGGEMSFYDTTPGGVQLVADNVTLLSQCIRPAAPSAGYLLSMLRDVRFFKIVAGAVTERYVHFGFPTVSSGVPLALPDATFPAFASNFVLHYVGKDVQLKNLPVVNPIAGEGALTGRHCRSFSTLTSLKKSVGVPRHSSEKPPPSGGAARADSPCGFVSVCLGFSKVPLDPQNMGPITFTWSYGSNNGDDQGNRTPLPPQYQNTWSDEDFSDNGSNSDSEDTESDEDDENLPCDICQQRSPNALVCPCSIVLCPLHSPQDERCPECHSVMSARIPYRHVVRSDLNGNNGSVTNTDDVQPKGKKTGKPKGQPAAKAKPADPNQPPKLLDAVGDILHTLGGTAQSTDKSVINDERKRQFKEAQSTRFKRHPEASRKGMPTGQACKPPLSEAKAPLPKDQGVDGEEGPSTTPPPLRFGDFLPEGSGDTSTAVPKSEPVSSGAPVPPTPAVKASLGVEKKKRVRKRKAPALTGPVPPAASPPSPPSTESLAESKSPALAVSVDKHGDGSQENGIRVSGYSPEVKDTDPVIVPKASKPRPDRRVWPGVQGPSEESLPDDSPSVKSGIPAYVPIVCFGDHGRVLHRKFGLMAHTVHDGRHYARAVRARREEDIGRLVLIRPVIEGTVVVGQCTNRGWYEAGDDVYVASSSFSRQQAAFHVSSSTLKKAILDIGEWFNEWVLCGAAAASLKTNWDTHNGTMLWKRDVVVFNPLVESLRIRYYGTSPTHAQFRTISYECFKQFPELDDVITADTILYHYSTYTQFRAVLSGPEQFLIKVNDAMSKGVSYSAQYDYVDATLSRPIQGAVNTLDSVGFERKPAIDAEVVVPFKDNEKFALKKHSGCVYTTDSCLKFATQGTVGNQYMSIAFSIASSTVFYRVSTRNVELALYRQLNCVKGDESLTQELRANQAALYHALYSEAIGSYHSGGLLTLEPICHQPLCKVKSVLDTCAGVRRPHTTQDIVPEFAKTLVALMLRMLDRFTHRWCSSEDAPNVMDRFNMLKEGATTYVLENHKHPKFKERLRAVLEWQEDSSVGADNLRKVEGKFKQWESAKPGKYGRLFVSLGVQAAIYCPIIPTVMKEAMSTGWVRLTNECQEKALMQETTLWCQFVGSPTKAELTTLFREAYEKSLVSYTVVFVVFSDDAIMLHNDGNCIRKSNVDIASCDQSIGPAIFAFGAIFQAKLGFDPDRSKILIRNCRAEMAVFNPANRQEYAVFRPKVPCLYSGTVLTTPTNTIGSLCIGVSYLLGVVEGWSIEKAASMVGFAVTNDECPHFEDMQFLKHSPCLDTQGDWQAVLNITTVLRRYGQYKGEPPAGFPNNWEDRWCEINAGLVRTQSTPVVAALLERFPPRISKTKAEHLFDHFLLDSIYTDAVADNSIVLDVNSYCLRYRISVARLDDLCDLLRGAEFGSVITHDVLNLMFAKDYGLPPP